VVNIIGRGGHHPTARYLAGGAINAALLNITQSLAEDCGPDNVLVNGINPGATATPRQQTLVAQKAKLANRPVEEIIAESTANIPLGRIGRSEDVAALATYLCSEQASFINGALMEVDGGASRAL
ncbi:MAG: SDR family oxidoreductase, partial [Alphaproteobacteria bacterium]